MNTVKVTQLRSPLAALLIIGFLLAATTNVFAIQSTVLAKGNLPGLPDGGLLFRAIDITVDPNDPPVTHEHGPGMQYALEGPMVVTENGQPKTYDQGQAAWVVGTTHTHSTVGGTASRYLVLSIFPIALKGTPPLPGFRKADVVYEGENLNVTNRQGQEVTLTEMMYAAGEDGGAQTYAGPVLLSVQAGAFTAELGAQSRKLQAGDFVTVQPGTSIHVRADAGAAGRILMLSVIPAGQPTTLPTTGGVDFPWMALALAALILLSAGWWVRRARVGGV
jgi:quercetin dioxygenase-like cupin family protein